MQNAAIVYLTRYHDLWEFIPSLKLLYKNFNTKYDYPVIVFHDDLTPTVVSAILLEMNAYLGRVPNIKFERMTLDVPSWVSLDPAKYVHPEGHPISLQNFSMGYRVMCRFFAGTIVNHPALKDYRYYMRVDSDSYLLSHIQVDPFDYMAQGGYHYTDCAFPLLPIDDSHTWEYAGKEISWAREGLWETTQEFINTRSHDIKSPPATYDGELYNSNMIVVDMDFFRSKNYQDYFEHLDRTGNLFYRRWGDHCIQWLGLRLFSEPSKILCGMNVMKFCYQHGSLIIGLEYADAESVELLPEIFKKMVHESKTGTECI